MPATVVEVHLLEELLPLVPINIEEAASTTQTLRACLDQLEVLAQQSIEVELHVFPVLIPKLNSWLT